MTTLTFGLNHLPRPSFCEAEVAYTRRQGRAGWAVLRCTDADYLCTSAGDQNHYACYNFENCDQ